MATQKWQLETVDHQIRVIFNGETIAESTNAKLLIEHRGELRYYFPQEDVRQDLLKASEHTESSGYRGTAHFYHLTVGDKISKNVAWHYPETKDGRPDVTNHIAFKWHGVDSWFEEDEEIFGHIRSPYHRVDAYPSSRNVKVVIDGETIAESNNPVIVAETGLVTRYYLPQEDVNFDYLTTTDAESVCPYKGFANYWTVNVGDKQYDNIVWSYADPIDQQQRLKDLVAFWTEKDNSIELFVDGEKK